MKVVIQRVKSSKVEVNNKIIGQIDHGILVLIGVAVNDEKTDAEWISNKVLNLRIFDDENGVIIYRCERKPSSYLSIYINCIY